MGAGPELGSVGTAGHGRQTVRQPLDLEAAVQLEDVEISSRRGAAKLPPVVELDGAQIDALGQWDIGGVLRHLDDFYGGQGEALVLINGQRVPLSSIFNSFPPDAAVRVEVLPPEAAGLYGGRAGQAVYNLVLQPRYASRDADLSHTAPTAGANSAQRLNAQISTISGQNSQQGRFSLSRDTGLSYGDREVRDAAGMLEDPRLSLKPQSWMADLGGSMSRNLGDWGLMLSGTARTSETESQIKLGTDVVTQKTQMTSANLSVGLSGQVLGWHLNANSQANLAKTQQSGSGTSESENHSVNLGVTAGRSLFSLPAGDLTTHLSATLNRSQSSQSRHNLDQTSSTDFYAITAGLNLPLIRAGEQGLGRLGGLQANLSLGLQTSGGSQGQDQSIALAWQPQTKLRVNLTWSQSLMGGIEAMRHQPQTYGAPLTVYDFRRNEAIEVLPLLGGNPELTPPRQTATSLNLSAGPFSAWQWSTHLNLSRSEAREGLGTLGALTEEIQTLFPERFVRDADGRLVEVDFRPFNTGWRIHDSLGGGLNLNLPLGRWVGERAPTGTSAQVRIGFNRHLRSVSQILPGEPIRDSLIGDGGGQSRQDARLGVDVRWKPVTVNLNLRWQEGYRTRRTSGVDGADDLVRGDLWNTDLRLSWQISKTGAAEAAGGAGQPRRRMAGSELALDISNLFDHRQEVRLGDGSMAPGFGRDRLDPMGRTLALNLRHRF